MQFSTSVLFYFLATAGVAAGETSTSTIKDDVGDGGENKMSFSLSYANNDGSTCAPCLLCEGSAFHNVFDPKIASMCISCTDDASCDEAIITNSFQKAWVMTYVSLTSHGGDVTFDPETISILASDDYDEGSKTGIWSALATSSSALVFQQRNMPQDIVFDNSVMHSHYRFVFRRKDNVNTMKIGHVGVVQSYLKTYAAELFNKITQNEVIGLPTKAPTAAPTALSTTLVFDNDSLKTAVNEWISNKEEAMNKYGDIQHWNTGEVTSMNQLFSNKITFNDNVSKWDTSSVSDMYGMFYLNKAFDIDLSSWDTSNVTDMSAMFLHAYIFNQDVSTWNVAEVNNMYNMFGQAQLFNQNISGWNIAKVAKMHYMFYRAYAFKQRLCWNVDGKEVGNMFNGSPGSIGCD